MQVSLEYAREELLDVWDKADGPGKAKIYADVFGLASVYHDEQSDTGERLRYLELADDEGEGDGEADDEAEQLEADEEYETV